jgi:broad specificity phosphatase PhoE
MPTKLVLIRHAQSIWNEAGRWQGHANPPLAETGRAQARLLARRLSTWNIDHLYASDLDRAATTAAIVGQTLGLRPTIDPIWRESGIGVLEGLTTAEIETRYPEVWASRRIGPMIGIPGAEGHEVVLGRAAAGCAALLARHPDENVAVVSHAGMILATLVHLLGLPPSGLAILTGGAHTAISQVLVDNGHTRLIGLNDAAHLELMEVQEAGD